MEMHVEEPMDTGTVVDAQSKRYDKVEEEAAKRRKVELDAEERNRRAVEVDRWMSQTVNEEQSTDYFAFQAKQFRQFWDSLYHNPKGPYGFFEDETTICAKRFTDELPPCGGHWRSTLQVFSVKVTGLSGGLQLPLDIYGMVAMRDTLDHNRNIIFRRERNNCQTLTKEDSSLELTGPIRAVILGDPVIFEVELKVRNTTESEDSILSFLAARFRSTAFAPDSTLFKQLYTSKLSTLEFKVGHIFYSVEATISVKVMMGSWRDDSHGQFSASTVSIKDEEVVLLDFGDDKVLLDGDNIFLSRSVVSVELEGKLIVSIKTHESDKDKVEAVVEDSAVFTPLEMGRSRGELDVGFCKMEVTVAWSLFAEHPDFMSLC